VEVEGRSLLEDGVGEVGLVLLLLPPPCMKPLGLIPRMNASVRPRKGLWLEEAGALAGGVGGGGGGGGGPTPPLWWLGRCSLRPRPRCRPRCPRTWTPSGPPPAMAVGTSYASDWETPRRSGPIKASSTARKSRLRRDCGAWEQGTGR
jgi:hypothetical protein